MRFVFNLIIILIVVGLIAVVAVPFFVPTDYLRDQIAQMVKAQTGRDFTVAGEILISFVPNVGVRLGQVILSDPPTMSPGTMLKMDALTVNLRLLPLLFRQIKVKQFLLERPVFDFRVDRDGRRNWDFTRLTGVAERRAVARGQGVGDKDEPRARRAIYAEVGGFSAVRLEELSFDDVRIIDGTIKFSDVQSGTRQKIDAVNLRLSLPGISEPLDAEGMLDWRQEEVTLTGKLDSPWDLLGEAASPLKFRIVAAHMTTKFEGEARFGRAPRIKGAISGSSPSVRNLAAWLGSPLPTIGGFGAAKASSSVTATPDMLTFANLRLTMDGMTGEGNASVRLGGARPHLRAALTLDKLDLNVFMRPAPTSPRRAIAARPAAPSRPDGTTPAEDHSLTDFIEQLNRQDEGRSNKRAPLVRGWSQRALDFTALNRLDADVNFIAVQMLYERIKIGKSTIKVTIRSGELTVDLNEMQLYGGRGTGRFVLNGARSVPSMYAKFDLAGLSALTVLKDAIAFDWISGNANFNVTLAGVGRSQNEIVSALQGNGSVRFDDGAIEGINILQLIRSISLGQIQGVQRNARLRTDFTQMTGTIKIENGIVLNSDLRLEGPLVRMNGAGRIDLPREWINYSIEPRLVANLEGQGGDQNVEGLVIPVKIEGPLANPGIKPDIERLLQNPEAAARQLRDMFKGGKKNLGGVLGNIIGRSRGIGGGQVQSRQGGQAPTGQSQKKIQPKDSLNQIFR